ncbi:MAG: hypothetical protein WC486_05595 [Candidatus Omnitrophota bacterium]
MSKNSKKPLQHLLLEDVYAIKRSGNPNKPFAPNARFGDLEGRTYQEIVEIFESRISGWYFDVAEAISDKIPGYNFAVIILNSIILDLLSQYIYGAPTSSESIFKRFFREYLGEYNHKIDPPIVSCYFNKRRQKWMREVTRDVADGFYHCFRCGVVHAAGILEYGRISSRYPEEIIKVIDWGQGAKEINVNAIELLRRLRSIFNAYIGKLKNSELILKHNFIEKFQMDYGVTIKRC